MLGVPETQLLVRSPFFFDFFRPLLAFFSVSAVVVLSILSVDLVSLVCGEDVANKYTVTAYDGQKSARLNTEALVVHFSEQSNAPLT